MIVSASLLRTIVPLALLTLLVCSCEHTVQSARETAPDTWMHVAEHANFSPRDTASGVVFLDKMWISNGYPDMRDLWCSSDGTSWTKVLEHTPYDAYSSLIVHDGKLWAIKNSVWFSRNGVDWIRALKQVPFRVSSEVLEYDGRMWAFGSGAEVW